MTAMLRCGIYLRISREGNKLEESDSIANQRRVIVQYMQMHREMKLCHEWVDDGVSGTHFQRPGIQSLFQAVEEKRVDCILVKDLSRFGREYIETGYYLQEYFPNHHIRFIAVCDDYDSQDAEFMEGSLLFPILNILNDAYCQDISRKVRQQQKIKREEGTYIGAFCVYGYRKAPWDKNKLIKDAGATPVVRHIFERRVQGESAEKIARYLNEKNILSPLSYKRKQNPSYRSGFAKGNEGVWSPTAVRRILQNEMYTGVMIQGKRKKISYKLPNRVWVPREEWDIVDGKIEAIITKEMYRKAQIPLRKTKRLWKGVDCDV